MAGALFWIGLVIYLCGKAWLVYLAWSNDKVGMAIGIFFCTEVFGIVYLVTNWDEAKIPFAVTAVGGVLYVAGRVLGAA